MKLTYCMNCGAPIEVSRKDETPPCLCDECQEERR